MSWTSIEDRVGQKFNMLTVLAVHSKGFRTTEGRYVQARLLCRCDCGTVKDIPAGAVTGGCTKSCGCLDRDILVARNTTHGMSSLPEYKLWKDMRARCNNPSNKFYFRYGGRGISVSPEWQSSFENFYKDMGPRPARRMSIERIENDGHYCKSNCKWATPIEQANNRSSTRLVTYKGSTQSLSAWCRELNINLSTVTGRLDVHGWSVEDAFGTPTRKGFVERNKTKNAVAPVDEGIL